MKREDFDWGIESEEVTPSLGIGYIYVAKVVFYKGGDQVPADLLKERWGVTEQEAESRVLAQVQEWLRTLQD